MRQAVQLVGAALILGAYVAAQRGLLRFDSVRFLALNTVGATILAVIAALGPDYGLLLLEGVWAWVSARGLRKAIKAEKEAKREEELKKRSSRSAARTARRRNKHNPLRGV